MVMHSDGDRELEDAINSAEKDVLLLRWLNKFAF